MDNTQSYQSNKVLVIGGGAGGIRATLDLAESGREVVLIDQAYAIGGLMTQLDRTFPTNNCDLCTLSPHLSESGRAHHIRVVPMTELTRIAGSAGAFEVTLMTRPRYIDTEKCTACGACHAAFPECVRFTPGLDHRAPTCMRYPQATPHAFSIDREQCADMAALVAVCKDGAILPDDQPREQKLRVGAVIVAVGAALFDPAHLDHFGQGQCPDIVTSLAYERILSASGPTGGALVRPSDGKQPRHIAWVQCVGSRGIQKGAESYCSSVCCMFAMKEAIVTRERFGNDIATDIFYMDIRAFGKDYEKYYQRAREEFGVRFIRSRPHSVFWDKTKGMLAINYATEDDNGNQSAHYDMVVLSTGFRASRAHRELAATLGIDLNPHGYAATQGLQTVVTSRPGIFVCGMFESPKDIPETMIQGSAAASCAMALTTSGPSAAAAGRAPTPPLNKPDQLDELDVWNISEDLLPPERDVTGQMPRTGVFVCDCGTNIGGVLDAGKLAAYAATLAGVVTSAMVGHGCSRDALARIREAILEDQLNRVVVAGCSPRTHEGKFQEAIRQAGLNKYLLEMANIRDQDTWVHMDQPEAAMAKAQELIRMAVARVHYARPLTDYTLTMNRDILVVGGGVAGMTAALSLADQGLRVFLAERSGQLGGLALKVHKTIEGDDVQSCMREMIRQVQGHPRIQVLAPCIIVDHTGMPGMLVTGVQTGPQMYYRQIRHGVTILATGALARRPDAYLLGWHPAVCTQLDLEAQLADQPETAAGWQTVAMIQCVGSRTADNPNCSRICCQAAIKNALHLLDLNPDLLIFVFYRDMRTYGFQENYYQEARRRGVIFVRYEAEAPPRVAAEGDGITLTFHDFILGRDLALTADRLCLSTGLIADDEATEDLAAIFKLPRTDDGYFLEDHVKLRPVDLPVPGFFVAGTAHAPRNIKESIVQARAAAGRARTMLAREVINLGAAVARVDGKKCAACLICVRVCPYHVPFINADGYSEIDPAKCHGCGTCAAECPARAIQLMQYEDAQMLARLDGLFERMN